MKYVITFLSLLLLSLPFLTHANTVETSQQHAESTSNIIKKISPYSVHETMDKFEAIVKKKGFGIFARIDHQKNAKRVDLEMNEAQVLIFGNPKGGTMLMKKDMSVSLDLPLRVAIYHDADGNVYIAYHDPVSMTSGYNLKDHQVIQKVTKGLDKLTSAAIAAQK